MALRIESFVGLLVFIALAWLASENRRAVSWRLVFWGVALQFAMGLLILHTGLRQWVFSGMSVAVDLLTRSTVEGAKLLFGPLAENPKLMAFQALPVIIFVSAITAVLQHLRIIQAVVHAIAWVMRRTLKTSGAETFSAALQVFLGIEAMPALRSYMKAMTRSELLTVMTTFMASSAGSVLVIYSKFGAEPGHLLTASLMSAPAAIVMAKLLIPETGKPETSGEVFVRIPVDTRNVLDAAAQGTGLGLTMALNVGAMLIAFIALVYLLDQLFLVSTGYTFVDLMSLVFRPIAWLMGVPAHDVGVVAQLLGKKTVLNEILGYIDLKAAIQQGQISQRAVTISTYALCGFANPGSIGILIAGLGALIPERRAEVTSLAVKSFIGGTLACFMTACVAGVLVYA